MTDDFKSTVPFSPAERLEHEEHMLEELPPVPNDFKGTVPFSPAEQRAHEEMLQQEVGALAATVVSGGPLQPSLWNLCQTGDFVLVKRPILKHVFDDYPEKGRRGDRKNISVYIPDAYVFDRINHYSSGSIDLRCSEGSILAVPDISSLLEPVRIFRPGRSIDAQTLFYLPAGTPICCDIEYKIGNKNRSDEGSYFHYAGFLGEKTSEEFQLHADTRRKVLLHKYNFNDSNEGALPQYLSEQVDSSLVGYGKLIVRQLVPADQIHSNPSSST